MQAKEVKENEIENHERQIKKLQYRKHNLALYLWELIVRMDLANSTCKSLHAASRLFFANTRIAGSHGRYRPLAQYTQYSGLEFVGASNVGSATYIADTLSSILL